MGNERPVVSQADAERVRRRIAETGEKALDLLAAELKLFGRKKDSGTWVHVPVPETWVRNFRHVADQLRRDYRLEEEGEASQQPSGLAAPAAAAEVSDPLAQIKLLDTDEAA